MYNYGIRNPKIENKKSIEKYLISNNLAFDNSFSLKDTASLNLFYKSNIGTPEIRFYDKNGYLMLYRDDKKCNGQNDSLISFLDPLNVVKIDSANNIYHYLNTLRTLDGKPLNSDEFKNYDYYLIIYWAKWLGKVNSIKMKDWENSLSTKNNLNIKTIKVSTDYIDFWALNKKDMIKVYKLTTKTAGEKH